MSRSLRDVAGPGVVALALGLAAALGLGGALLRGPAWRARGSDGSRRAGPATAAKAQELNVFAAASLRESFAEAGSRFERAHAGVHVAFAFAGSQQLRLQIEQGAAADVFASADLRQAQALREAGLILPPRVFARNELALIVPRGNPDRVLALRDLPRARRLVIAGPEVPAGRYTERLFAAAGDAFGASFEAALRARVVSRELDVRQVLAKVALGEADAGIVYRTDARSAAASLGQIELPGELNQTADYPIAATAEARDPGLAAAFVDFVLSREGQAVLAARGFLPPPPAAPASAAPASAAPAPAVSAPGARGGR